MANGSNTRSVFTRVSVQDVDKATRDLTKFGADGDRALTRLERAATKPTRALAKLDKASKGTGTAISALGRQVALIDGPLGGVSSRFSAAASSVSNFGILATGAAAGVAAVGFALAGSLRAANEYQKVMFSVGATLQATGFASGKTAQEIDALSISIGRATLASTREVREASNILLTFRSVAGDTFDRTLNLAQDLAAVGMGSLTSSTLQLGKALEDPVKGISALTRVGVSFTTTQQDMIRGMAEAGDVAGAQALILDELERQVGGAGVAQAGGLAGAYDTLSENVGIFLEHMGNSGPIETATESMQGLAWVVQELDKVFFPDLNQQIEDTLKKIQGAKALGFLGPIFGVDRGELEAQLAAIQKQMAAQRRESEEALRKSGIVQANRAAEAKAAKEAADEQARAEKIGAKLLALEDKVQTAGFKGMAALGRQRRLELEQWQRQLDKREISEEEFGRARVAINARYGRLIDNEADKQRQASARRRVKWAEDLAKDQRQAYERTFEGGVATSADRYFDQVSNAGANAGRVITSAFSEVEDALTNFFMGAGISFESFFDSVAKGLARLAAQDVIASIGGLLGIGAGSSGGLLSGIVSGLGNFVGGIFGFAEGGQVRGPGTGRSDSVPALLSNGEFVVNAQSSRRYAPLLRAINADRYADGRDPSLGGYPTGKSGAQMAGEARARAVLEGRDPGSAGIVRPGAVERERQRIAEERALVEQLLFGPRPTAGPPGSGRQTAGAQILRVRDMTVLDRIRRFVGMGRPGGFTGSSAAGGLLSILGNLVKGLFKSSPIGLLASAVVSIGGNLAREYLTGGAAKSTGIGGMIYEHFAGGRPINRQISDAMERFGERLAGAEMVGPGEGRDGRARSAARFMQQALSGSGGPAFVSSTETAFADLTSGIGAQWAKVQQTGNRVMSYQTGGRVAPGREVLVGEDGPELARFDGPATISPLDRELAVPSAGSGVPASLITMLEAVALELDETNRLLRMMVSSGQLGRRTAFAS